MMRRTYVRSMAGWWRRDPVFIRYMAREATALFVVIYAAILLVTVARLAQGETSFNAWMALLAGKTSIALHAILVAAFAYHTYTWFEIMPKTMPPIRIAGRKLAPGVITGVGLAVSAILSVALFALASALPP